MRSPWSWVIVVLIAVSAAAPLIAGDRPYALYGDAVDGWRLPLLRSFSIADWLWLIAPLQIVLSWRAAGNAQRDRWARARWLIAAAVAVALLPVAVSGVRATGGDGWIDALAGRDARWWIGSAALLIAAVAAGVIARRCSRSAAINSVMSMGLATFLLLGLAARCATVDRPVIDATDDRALVNNGNAIGFLPPIAHGWDDVALEHRLQTPGYASHADRMHLLGTDDVGADVAARLIHGTRIAVTVGLVSAALAVGIGAALGLLMGYFGGLIDLLGMRLVELLLAVPRLFLILSVIVFLPSRDSDVMLAALVLVIGLTGWMRPARLMRAEVMRLRRAEYVLAARAIGTPTIMLLGRHLLPIAAAPVLVDGGFAAASAILIETNLSFLGLGVQPPQPSWGAMLEQAIDPSTGVIHWWLAAAPTALILFTVLACNGLSEALRRRLHGRGVGNTT